MDLRREIEQSFDRLPKVQRCLLEILLSGYYRIQHTEGLIKQAIICKRNLYDEVFWGRALFNESGHAAVYRQELDNFTGRATQQLIDTYRPCDRVRDLLEWVRAEPLARGAMYRAYLEVGVMLMPTATTTIMQMLMPRTINIHRTHDTIHSEDCFKYIHEQWPCNEGKWLLEVEYIEGAFTAELQHSGLRG